MQEDSFNKFLQNAAVEKYAQGVYLIYNAATEFHGVWFEYHRKQKKFTGGWGFPLTQDQIDRIDALVQKAFHKTLKEKSDARAAYWADYIDYEEVYGLDNGWN